MDAGVEFLTPQSSSTIPALTSKANVSANDGSFSGSLPVYTRNTLKSLVLNMPVDAFTDKAWDGSNSMVGLVPPRRAACTPIWAPQPGCG